MNNMTTTGAQSPSAAVIDSQEEVQRKIQSLEGRIAHLESALSSAPVEVEPGRRELSGDGLGRRPPPGQG